jgi:hypothetical protein
LDNTFIVTTDYNFVVHYIAAYTASDCNTTEVTTNIPHIATTASCSCCSYFEGYTTDYFTYTTFIINNYNSNSNSKIVLNIVTGYNCNNTVPDSFINFTYFNS